MHILSLVWVYSKYAESPSFEIQNEHVYIVVIWITIILSIDMILIQVIVYVFLWWSEMTYWLAILVEPGKWIAWTLHFLIKSLNCDLLWILCIELKKWHFILMHGVLYTDVEWIAFGILCKTISKRQNFQNMNDNMMNNKWNMKFIEKILIIMTVKKIQLFGFYIQNDVHVRV